jgi:NAD-specific glutamate dehydrogenase
MPFDDISICKIRRYMNDPIWKGVLETDGFSRTAHRKRENKWELQILRAFDRWKLKIGHALRQNALHDISVWTFEINKLK